MYDIICVLAILGIVSFIPRKIYMTWFAQIQYYYIGIIYCIRDKFNVKYNKDGKKYNIERSRNYLKNYHFILRL